MHPTSRKNPFREREMQIRKHGIEADRQDRRLHHGSSPIALPWAAKKLQPMASSSYHCGLLLSGHAAATRSMEQAFTPPQSAASRPLPTRSSKRRRRRRRDSRADAGG